MDIALKQRLVGASVLIALAVVVLPMLLGGRPDGESRETQVIELPPQPPELDFETRRYPIGEKAPQPDPVSGQVVVKPLPTPGQPTDQTAGQAPQPAPPPAAAELLDESSGEVSARNPPAEDTGGEAVTTSQAPVIRAAPPPVERTTDSGRYVVQVASFGAMANANRLAETLRGYGYSVMLDSVKSDAGTLHRVRVGPYASESDANGVVSKLQAQVENLKPRVMDLQPEKAAQVAQPSDPMVRWVVQVGSFSDASNADNLVARLRLESMSAYREEVNRSGSVIYRVRVGPFLEREDAIEADKRVAERLSIDGVVMSTD